MKKLFPVDYDLNLVYREDVINNNVFRKARLDGALLDAPSKPLPTFEASKKDLPIPYWKGHEDFTKAYYRAWEIAFSNLHKANVAAGFVSDYIDSAFSDYLFMWDSCFCTLYGRYAARIFNFQNTLNNFYCNQYRDGFMCREICESAAGGQFSDYDPVSTGPNILAWCEWNYYLQNNDKERLALVYAPILNYHKWTRENRSWPDYTYWSTGWGCGMDNQPRMEKGYDYSCSHAFMTWIDATAQAYLSARLLLTIADELGLERDPELVFEEEKLASIINNELWDADDAFYYDRYRNGKLNKVKSVAGYWTLLAGLVPADRRDAFVAHLDNEKEFKRPVRVPTLSADHPEYDPEGGYWKGAIWAPTDYMILQALRQYGYDRLAHDIAMSFTGSAVQVCNDTNTLWENYAPEAQKPGNPANPNFVGWSGLATISCYLEYVLGLEPHAAEQQIDWYVNLLEEHGVDQYPLGDATVSLHCAARQSTDEEPVITVKSDKPVKVVVHWNGKEKVVEG